MYPTPLTKETGTADSTKVQWSGQDGDAGKARRDDAEPTAAGSAGRRLAFGDGDAVARFDGSDNSMANAVEVLAESVEAVQRVLRLLARFPRLVRYGRQSSVQFRQQFQDFIRLHCIRPPRSASSLCPLTFGYASQSAWPHSARIVHCNRSPGVSGGSVVKKSMPKPQPSEKDQLLTRPPGALPTPLDPAGPESHGYPKDPKLVPATGQGDPDGVNPAPGDMDRSA
jgi:hypothetical protein